MKKKDHDRIEQSVQVPINYIRQMTGAFLAGGGPEKEMEERALCLIYALATYLQEMAFCVQGGDVEEGMELLSSAINRSQADALKMLSKCKKM